jgi:lipopolysaccharide transport system permease protein
MEAEITYSNKPETFKSYLIKLIKHREMLLFFIWRLFRLRLKQSYFGVLWAIVRPLFPALIYAALAQGVSVFIGVGGQSFFQILCLYLIWFLAQSILSDVSESLHYDVSIIKKIAFPKIFIPIAHSVLRMIDFLAVVLVVYVAGWLAGVQGEVPLFPYVLTAVGVYFFITGFSLLMARINVEKKDIGNVIPFITQVMFVSAPIAFTITSFPLWAKVLLAFNPVTSAIGIIRDEYSLALTIACFAVAALSALVGVFIFYKYEGLIPEKI